MEKSLVFWNPWWSKKDIFNIYHRSEYDYFEKLILRKEVLFFTGVRRCGKTSAMFYIIKKLIKKIPSENILYINLEDTILSNYSLDDIYTTYNDMFPDKTGKTYIFLDEIQNIDSWEKWIKKMYDSFENIKFFILGSKSNILKKNSALLTGRMIEITVYPLNFNDFLKFNNFNLDKLSLISKKSKILSLFKEYFKYGGFPEIVLEKDTDMKIKLLKEYYDNIKNKDIIVYFNIKESKKFNNLSYFIISNISKKYSSNKIGSNINLSTSVVEDYLNYSELMNFFLTLNHFSYSVKAQITMPRKIYSIDTGMINAVSFKFSENIGRFLENLVFIELKRKNKELYYFSKKYECDFVIKQGLNIIEAIQVCYELTEENKKREISGLVEAMKEFKLKQGLILTYNDEDEIIRDNKKILIKPVWKWLLE